MAYAQSQVLQSDAVSMTVTGINSAAPQIKTTEEARMEFLENRSIKLEWRITQMQRILDASKGDSVKSKCLKSALFGDGLWQVYLYANSGTEPPSISLYISAEPSAEEKERGKAMNPSGNALAADGTPMPTWVRRGRFRFLFEMREDDRFTPIKAMEAQDHAFDSNSRTWGWTQFIKRADLAARLNHTGADTIVVNCQITSHTTPPSQAPAAAGPPTKIVPISLVDAYASLFDDPSVSDVVFVFPGRRPGKTRRLYASKRILMSRSEYFRDAFSGAWADLTDDEDDNTADEAKETASEASADEDGLDDDAEPITPQRTYRPRTSTSALPSRDGSPQIDGTIGMSEPTTPSRAETPAEADVFMSPIPTPQKTRSGSKTRKPSRTKVTVTDASYRTFRSLIYYLYTDQIAFAPLASIFFERREACLAAGEVWPWRSRTEWAKSFTPTSAMPGAARPADAKAIYAVSDKLMLPELKSRAFEHIKRSLSPSILALETFSSFSARFPEVQQFEVQELLQNWAIVRASPAMKKVVSMCAAGQGNWQGFQEVWHLVLSQLEWRPSQSADVSSLSLR